MQHRLPKVYLILTITLTGSCTWFQDYGHCSASVECDQCSDLTIDVEWVKDKDEREVKGPP